MYSFFNIKSSLFQGRVTYFKLTIFEKCQLFHCYKTVKFYVITFKIDIILN